MERITKIFRLENISNTNTLGIRLGDLGQGSSTVGVNFTLDDFFVLGEKNSYSH